MIHLTHPLPDNNKFFVACSGGVDSMSALHWLARGNRMPYAIIHVHHNTGAYADRALQFVAKHYQDYCFDLIVKHVKGVPPQGASKEDWWRKKRYEAFEEVLDSTGKDYPIVLAHNLDDCVEQFVISTMVRIKSNTIINYNGPANTIRPFRTWPKKQIIEYANSKELEWVEDPSNSDTKYVRNNIRHKILPLLREINPGIDNHVKNLIINQEQPNVK